MNRLQCFVVMPFGLKEVEIGGSRRLIDFEKVYDEVIRPAIEEGIEKPLLRCVRADRDPITGIIGEQVINRIHDSPVAVVDVTGHNANVYYELGIRHALKRNVTALIGYSETDLPFNIRGIAVLNYRYDTPAEIEAAKKSLANYVSGSFERAEVDSPVFRYLSDLRVKRRTVVCREDKPVEFRLKAYPDRVVGFRTGDIKEIQGVDVWVNSENTDMEMARFQEKSISSAIRYLGSKRDANTGEVVDDVICKDLRRQMKGRKALHGQVIVTKAGSLKANGVKKVFHVASVSGNPLRGFKLLEPVGACVTASLRKLESENARLLGRKAKSILLPLFGTGQAEAPPDAIADELVSSAVTFLSSRPALSFEKVYFLAYFQDHAELLARVFMKFEDKLERVT